MIFPGEPPVAALSERVFATLKTRRILHGTRRGIAKPAPSTI